MSEPSLPERMRHDLIGAMKRGDRPAVAALRQTLAAIGNAEAPPLPERPLSLVPTEPVPRQPQERPRLDLTPADIERVIRAEVAEREAAAAEYVRIGRQAEAEAVTAEATVLRAYLR